MKNLIIMWGALLVGMMAQAKPGDFLFELSGEDGRYYEVKNAQDCPLKALGKGDINWVYIGKLNSDPKGVSLQIHYLDGVLKLESALMYTFYSGAGATMIEWVAEGALVDVPVKTITSWTTDETSANIIKTEGHPDDVEENYKVLTNETLEYNADDQTVTLSVEPDPKNNYCVFTPKSQ